MTDGPPSDETAPNRQVPDEGLPLTSPRGDSSADDSSHSIPPACRPSGSRRSPPTPRTGRAAHHRTHPSGHPGTGYAPSPAVSGRRSSRRGSWCCCSWCTRST